MTPGPATFTLAAPADTTAQWSHLDIAAIVAQLEQTGVYAPAEQTPALEELVARADGDGNSLHIVVLDEVFTPFTVYRDIATELQQQTGGTVLVFGNGTVGTASDEFSRVELEDGSSQVTAMSDPVAASRQIYDKATDPYVNWTLVSIVMIVVVLIGAVIARMLTVRRRAAAEAAAASQPAATADDTDDDDTAAGDTAAATDEASSATGS